MTREEEIQKLIDEETGIENYGSSDYQVGLSDGVRLADNTMIKKAYEWLNMNIIDYITEGSREGISLENKKQLIEDFRKAMEE